MKYICNKIAKNIGIFCRLNVTLNLEAMHSFHFKHNNVNIY